MNSSEYGGQVIDLKTTFVILDEGGKSVSLAVDAELWENPVISTETARMVSMFRSEVNWSNWEMHPKGDEVIYQISGAMTLFLETEQGTEHVHLVTGKTFVVPAGIWHTADVIEPGDAIYMTLGSGTRQRPRLVDD